MNGSRSSVDAGRAVTTALLGMALVGCSTPKDQGSPAAEPAAKSSSAAVDDRSARFRCVGNEPGWSLAIRPDSLVFVGDYGEIRASYPAVVPRTGEGLWYYETENTAAPSGYSRLTVVVVRDSCSDGMSDRTYGYRTRLIHDLKGYVGCAERL